MRLGLSPALFLYGEFNASSFEQEQLMRTD
nr:MAG TPA: hypothetical protein [Crassvirales sp.]